MVVRFVIGRTRSPEQRRMLRDEVAHHGAFLNLPVVVSLGVLLATRSQCALPEGATLGASCQQGPLLTSLVNVTCHCCSLCPLPTNPVPTSMLSCDACTHTWCSLQQNQSLRTVALWPTLNKGSSHQPAMFCCAGHLCQPGGAQTAARFCWFWLPAVRQPDLMDAHTAGEQNNILLSAGN